MYLHKDREIFKNTVEDVAISYGLLPVVIEKDYYVTLILRFLSEQLDNCVFKGGTSLSKGFHAIDRFSEDIDITFDEHIGESRRKKLKNVTLKGIGEELGLPIANWNETQSDRDYNAYLFAYDSVFDLEDDRMPHYVKLETALGSYSFPAQVVEISNFIGDYLADKEREGVASTYRLDKFSMKLQSIERTYIDKVFVLCDYYMQGKSKRYSRHLYDIYKLLPRISFDDDFKKLINEVRKHRAQMEICPSAKADVNVPALLLEICDTDFYKDDYNTITEYFAADFVSYDDVIKNLRKLAEGKMFA
jgi:predicted nucleotidyltransferase component of viral defense system